MLESLTFFTFLSAAPTTLKFAHDAVELYTKVKTLRSSAPSRPLAKLESLTHFERNELKKMYTAVERCRPIAADIAGRALRSYLVVAGAVTILVIFVSIWAVYMLPIGLLLRTSVVIFVVGPILIWILPKLSPQVTSMLKDNILQGHADEIANTLESAWRDVRSEISVSFKATGVSIPERAFLKAYTQAEAMIRVLECDLLRGELRSGISAAYESLTGRVFEAAIQIIENLAKNGQLEDSKQRRKALEDAFGVAGLGDLVNPKLVGESFFEVDFKSFGKEELRKHLEMYMSSKSRR
jgi:hypothetical protein